MTAGAAASAPAAEPGFPTRPIRLLVGFSPGGGTDVAVRIIGKKLADIWGQQVVVDNRPGAGGLVAFEIVAKANPDGYTLLAASPSFAIQPSLAAKLPYDPIRDFAPITEATAAPYLLVVYPGVEAKSGEGADRAGEGKSRQAQLRLGRHRQRPAPGCRAFRLMAGINIVHVPYKGAVSVPDVIAGRVQMLFSGLPQGCRTCRPAGCAHWV